MHNMDVTKIIDITDYYHTYWDKINAGLPQKYDTALNAPLSKMQT